MSEQKHLIAGTWLVAIVLLLVIGCNDASTKAVPSAEGEKVAPAKVVEKPSGPTQVTFHVPGMNERLKILGGDGPNPVKQALSELDAVESVEDEWERDIEWEKDLDLLWLEYDPNRITVDQLLEKIREFEFEAKVSESDE